MVTRDDQAAKLAEVRAAAARARDECLAIGTETWDWMSAPLPVHNDAGELTDMLTTPSTRAALVWGARLTGDLLGCCQSQDDVEETLRRYFSLIKEPDHLIIVHARAFNLIATELVPRLLDGVESAGNYGARITLAEIAKDAWAARVNEVRRQDDQAGGDTPPW